MGKNNRHQKNLKSERGKVKLKAKKSKVLPKGQNITDTSFKVKKIVLKEQLKEHNEDLEILSRRKLNIKEILSRLQHHNSTVRLDAIKELKEVLQRHSINSLSSHLHVLLHGLSNLILDIEAGIRRDSLKVLNLILGPISKEELAPFSNILIIFLCSAMSHISPSIKEDSLNFLDVLIQNCSDVVANNSPKILTNFLDMISKHHSQSQINRHLSLSINSKNTTLKWRIKVFQRLSDILNSIIHYNKLNQFNNLNLGNERELVVDDQLFYLGVFKSNNLDICQLVNRNGDSAGKKEIFSSQEFNKYVNILMPLILDSWLEVSPKNNISKQDNSTISADAAVLLKYITSIIQYITKIINLIDDQSQSIKRTFRNNFLGNFSKYFLVGFPYMCSVSAVRVRKNRQEDYSTDLPAYQSDNCIEQNLNIALVYMWMVAIDVKSDQFSDNVKENCLKVIEYVNETLIAWSSSDTSLVVKLIKTLRIIFLKTSKVLYKNNISLETILKSVITASSKQSRYELHGQLFAIIGDIILDRNLKELHCEPMFINFVKTLPDLLLRSSIYDSTINILNRVVLQFRHWIGDELVKKQKEILENVKRISIVGSNDEKQSRLKICNLFYFIEGQIYY